MTQTLFYLLAASAVVTASLCILSRSPMTAVLWLVGTMLSLAGIYVVLNAQFVAAIQVEFLFEGAKDPKALREALNTRVKALAVGRVTADALREWGVKPFYVDETERLGSLLQGFKRALQKEVA